MNDNITDHLTPEAVSQRLDFHKRLAAEEAAARELAEVALTGPPRWWQNGLRDRAGSRTVGMVTVLLERAREIGTRSPSEALIVAELAGSIAGNLGIDDYPYQHVYTVRAEAQRDIAWFLTLIGRFDDAAAKAGYAEDLLTATSLPHVELARLDLVRANLARYKGNLDDAIALAHRAGATFDWFGERTRWLNACDIEAAAHYARHDYARALEVWESMREYLDRRDPAGRAGVLHNIAMCRRETGALDGAVEAFRDAAVVFAAAHMDVFRVAAHLNLGITLTMLGRCEESVPLLRGAWKEYESLDMKPDATIAALRLVEALLIANRYDDVPAICRHLIDWCMRAGMRREAMTALAFLRETLASGLTTPQHVRLVYDFLSAEDRRESLFAPQ